MRMRTAVFLAVLVASSPALARKVVVVGRVDGGPWMDAPTTARIDQKVELSFVETDRFIGADCADVMIGALRASGKRLAYTNVAGLPSYAKTIAKAVEVDARGMPAREVAGVQRGDLIRIDYGGDLRNHTPRNWDHVAALWEDKSDPAGPLKGDPDGKLDGFDLVIHVGHPRLKIEPLTAQSPATIDVLRWKK